MTTTPKTEEKQAMKLIFNYNNVFFSFFYDDTDECIHRSREYALNYVYSGEMVLDKAGESIHVRKGECVFIPRDHQITLHKKAYRGERYCGIFLMFTRDFLRRMFVKLGRNAFPDASPKQKPEVIKLPKTVELASLFTSMTPYFNPEIRPKDDFMELKMQEGLMALLAIDPRFAATMFDFNQPWKIDILDFLEKNYMYDLSLEEMAHYTGRSLATFKRDFKKISDLTPQKWLIRKRLEAAYRMIKDQRKKIVEVYSEVGFRNPSHFSTAFKKHFGVAPTAVSA